MPNEELRHEFMLLIAQTEEQLKKEKDPEEKTRQSFRLKSFNKFIAFLKKYPDEIKSGKQLVGISGIGQGTRDRVDEILKKGNLKEIKESSSIKKMSKNLTKIESLTEIIGIGDKMAKKLIDEGIKSAEDLIEKVKKKEVKVNNKIKLGLKYYHLYERKIPRKEMTKIADLLYETLDIFNGCAKGLICGSYRRGKPYSNDIDFLFTHKDIKEKSELDDSTHLKKLIKKLHNIGFLVDDLTDQDITTKYAGFCQLSSKHDIRRLDIRLVPYPSYYPAILYFTGSGDFNQKMRHDAKKKDYLLSEYGLYKLIGSKKKLIPVKSEKEIFEELNMKYLPPEERD